ncbi:Metallo-hydrolase/oxidoreductase [Cucurbitaria berberidis CBS 394.84]|uniref:Metallo-hydrolase/oxidoreductase n=1 Tax=Cucurbitaria berberidis CBS 394.84 TaxID=1168544 RepID=A0A9P4GE38_9PLEO|nr:Metallo-hydrolase/oxidoreductase [Cucurbitaria berberidis CBS 394.84]KAF1843826.1 Metallo-hydrolase/oxidoreductase [Cucurbitaria berberidis CBS 394.84]
MAEPLVPLPTIEKLSSRVIRVLGGNPSKFTLQGTNTYIVGQGAKRLLIDTGEGKPEWIASLKSVLDNEKIAIDKVILTHWHHDHVQGVPDLLDHSLNTKVYKNDPHDDWLDISDGQAFSTEGATLRALSCPGHTTDHMAFILEEEDAMFTGDNVLGQGTAVFEDLAAYMRSLDSMSKQFKGRAYPGHGPVIDDGPAKILEYIKHRKQREKQVLDVLAKDKEGGWTSMDIVKVIYKDYPENLWEPAEKGVLQILDKLQKEGKVAYDKGKGTWSLSGKSSL